MSRGWIRLLRCPVCRSSAPLERAPGGLHCAGCARGFAIEDGLPVLFDEARSAELVQHYQQRRSNGAWEALDVDSIAFARAPRGKSRLGRLFSSLRYPNWSVISPVDAGVLDARYRAGGFTLSLAGGANSPDLPNWINLDILPYPTVNVLGDATNLPFQDGAFNLVTTNSALEHIEDYQTAIKECLRVLKPGGHACICVPQVCGRHHTFDYWRWTLPGLKRAMRAFEIIEEGHRVGPGPFLAHLLESLVESVFPQPGVVREVARTSALWAAFPFRFVDRLGPNSPMSHHYAHTIYVIGRKPL